MKKKIKSTTQYRTTFVYSSPDSDPQEATLKYSHSEYDAEGHLLSEIKFNEEEEVEEKIVNQYDDKGRLIKELSYLDEHEVAEHKEYEWNKADQIDKAYKIYQDGEKDTIHYKRDKDGKLIEKITIDSYNEEEAREIIEHTDDKVKSRKVFEYDELMQEESYLYDKEGNMVEHTKWTMDDEEARYKNLFDEKGNLLEAHRYDLQGKLLSKAEYIFENDRLIKIVEEDSNNVNTTTLTYDEDGNAVGQEELNKTGKANNRAVRKFNKNRDVIQSEVWIYYHGRGVDQHYIMKYDYTYHE